MLIGRGSLETVYSSLYKKNRNLFDSLLEKLKREDKDSLVSILFDYRSAIYRGRDGREARKYLNEIFERISSLIESLKGEKDGVKALLNMLDKYKDTPYLSKRILDEIVSYDNSKVVKDILKVLTENDKIIKPWLSEDERIPSTIYLLKIDGERTVRLIEAYSKDGEFLKEIMAIITNLSKLLRYDQEKIIKSLIDVFLEYKDNKEILRMIYDRLESLYTQCYEYWKLHSFWEPCKVKKRFYFLSAGIIGIGNLLTLNKKIITKLVDSSKLRGIKGINNEIIHEINYFFLSTLVGMFLSIYKRDLDGFLRARIRPIVYVLGENRSKKYIQRIEGPLRRYFYKITNDTDKNMEKNIENILIPEGDRVIKDLLEFYKNSYEREIKDLVSLKKDIEDLVNVLIKLRDYINQSESSEDLSERYNFIIRILNIPTTSSSKIRGFIRFLNKNIEKILSNPRKEDLTKDIRKITYRVDESKNIEKILEKYLKIAGHFSNKEPELLEEFHEFIDEITRPKNRRWA